MVDEVVKVTKLWIERFVIGLQLCPFAHYSFYDDTIFYRVSSEKDIRKCRDELIEMAEFIRQKKESVISNSFLIFNDSLSFMDLLNLKEEFDEVMENDDHSIPLQSVVFHPDFQFADEDYDAHGNFINRSPYGMIHILRAEEVSRAIDATPNVQDIPFINKSKLEKIAIKSIAEIFEDDFVDKNR